jgi:hypothetical protein
MTWTDRLLRLVGRDAEGEVLDHLRDVHGWSAALAQRLAACAQHAPNQNAEQDLGVLVQSANTLVVALAQALQARGGPTGGAGAPLLNGAARNHWARLVAALEACREARARVLRHTPRLLELDPALVELLRQLGDGLDQQLDGLRALIARADPQAID